MSTDASTTLKPRRFAIWPVVAFVISTVMALGGLYYTKYYGDRGLDFDQKSYDLELRESRKSAAPAAAAPVLPAPGVPAPVVPSVPASVAQAPGVSVRAGMSSPPVVVSTRPSRPLECTPFERDGATMAKDCPYPASGRLRVDAALTSQDQALARFDVWAVVGGRTCNETRLGPEADNMHFECTLPPPAGDAPRTVRIRVSSPTQAAALFRAPAYEVNAFEVY